MDFTAPGHLREKEAGWTPGKPSAAVGGATLKVAPSEAACETRKGERFALSVAAADAGARSGGLSVEATVKDRVCTRLSLVFYGGEKARGRRERHFPSSIARSAMLQVLVSGFQHRPERAAKFGIALFGANRCAKFVDNTAAQR